MIPFGDREIVLLLCNGILNRGSRLVLVYRKVQDKALSWETVRRAFEESFTHEEQSRRIDDIGSFEVMRSYYYFQPLPTKLLSFRGRREVGGVDVIISQELPF